MTGRRRPAALVALSAVALTAVCGTAQKTGDLVRTAGRRDPAVDQHGRHDRACGRA